MEFKKYNSIENAYQKQVLEQIIIHGFDKETYVVQEKVHGANFSFFTNGKIIKIAKRSDFIEDSDKFYNAHKVLETYKEAVFKLFTVTKEKFPETDFVVIFGELFGGSYNHKEVPLCNNYIKVQKGIDYAPHNDFYAFDIKLNATKYLNVKDCNEIFEETGFFYAKTLFEGTLKEALEYPNEFNSLIPKWLKLPEIETNVCEGVIIRPLNTRYFGNGSRVILKNKNEKWSEKSNIKKVRVEQKETNFSIEGQVVWEKVQDFITVNRLYNVLSKEGEFTPKMLGKLIGLFAQDVLTDFKNENLVLWDTLEKEDQKGITKRLNNVIIKVIKEEFMTLKV